MFCVGEKRVGPPGVEFSWVKTAKRMRSMEVRSWRASMERVWRRTSRNLRSMAFCGAHGLARRDGLVADASEQLVEVGA